MITKISKTLYLIFRTFETDCCHSRNTFLKKVKVYKITELNFCTAEIQFLTMSPLLQCVPPQHYTFLRLWSQFSLPALEFFPWWPCLPWVVGHTHKLAKNSWTVPTALVYWAKFWLHRTSPHNIWLKMAAKTKWLGSVCSPPPPSAPAEHIASKIRLVESRWHFAQNFRSSIN